MLMLNQSQPVQQSGGMLENLMNPMSMVNSTISIPMGMVDSLGLMGGLSGKPGFAEGLFDENVPPSGINALWDYMGLSGQLQETGKSLGFGSPKNDLIRAAPIAGSIAGNIFLPGFGGPAGNMAGKLAAAMAFGTIGTDKPGYWTNRYNTPIKPLTYPSLNSL